MKKKPIYVICFYWQGERWREKGVQYKEEVTDVSFKNHLRRVGTVTKPEVSRYINNLYLGVKKWATTPFKFICFTNDKVTTLPEIEIRPFKMLANRGVIPRMYMFSEEAGLFGHQVLCLDLDVVITGPLTDIMNYSGTFCARPRFQDGQEHLPDGDIMSFKAGKKTENIFWKPLEKDIDAVINSTQGRERYWVYQCIGDKADLFSEVAPGQVVSFKKHVRFKEFPKEARIVSCHGFPRPHQINKQWRRENWK